MSDTLDPNNPLFYPTIIQLAKKKVRKLNWNRNFMCKGQFPGPV